MKLHKLIVPMLAVATAFSLVGCGKDSELTTYKEEMTTFCNNISTYNDAINSIDPASPTATQDLLANLDLIEDEFITLAELKVPSEFASVESLADEAGSYMTEAVQYYHTAFESDTYDEYSASLATQRYQRAIKRVQYIGTILMGELPEGEDVQVYYDDQNESAISDNAADSGEVQSTTSGDATTTE